MDLSTCPSLSHLFFAQAEVMAEKPFLHQKDKTGAKAGWSSLTYGEVAAAIRKLGQFLITQGIEPGDRVLIAIENRAEFPIADLAIMSIGGVTVPAFTTLLTEDFAYLLVHSGAKAAIFSSPAIAKRFLPALGSAPQLAFAIAIEKIPAGNFHSAIPIHDWRGAMEFAAPPAIEEAFETRLGRLHRRQIACFIYTSGTGGTPKGVMLSHGSILANIKGAFRLLADVGIGGDVFLSFLPLSHAYEHTAGQFLPIAMGAEIFYAESAEKLLDNMQEARPTIMTAVPRLYEVMQARILRQVQRLSPWRRRLFHGTVTLGRKAYENPKGLSLLERGLNPLLDRLVRRKIQAQLGGRLKAFVSGGAALNPEVGMFFLALGFRLLQGYGQTEASPVISANPPKRIRIETVGPIFEGLEARIAEDGEILVKGEALMLGYWQDEAATKAALQDGWLHTGDIGRIEPDGYLVITDRKKDIIVLSGGDNVAPARIENALTLEPEIAQAMVHGDGHPHLVALIVPDAEFRRNWVKERGLADDPEALASDKDFLKAMGVAVDRVNARLSSLEKIRRFALLAEGFTPENGQLTATLKIRRHKIREAHRRILADLLGGE